MGIRDQQGPRSTVKRMSSSIMQDPRANVLPGGDDEFGQSLWLRQPLAQPDGPRSGATRFARGASIGSRRCHAERWSRKAISVLRMGIAGDATFDYVRCESDLQLCAAVADNAALK
jgi:hypothetical protein